MKKDKAKANKGVMIGLRFSEEEFAPFKAAIEEMGCGISEYFRDYYRGKLDHVTHDKNLHKKHDELIRIFNKTSNNINQIAKRFNTLAKEGTITERQALICLNTLNRISESLLNGIDHVSKD